MPDAQTPAAAPSGYDTLLQVLTEMRKENAARDAAQAERDHETHRLLEALIGATEAHDGSIRELADAAKPQPGEGKGLKETLQEALAEGFAGLGEKIDAVPDRVLDGLDAPAPERQEA
jgi:hypothetical protein